MSVLLVHTTLEWLARFSFNQAILAYLQPHSAHSDVAQALIDSLKPLGDVQLFCPNPSQSRYLVASTQGHIFAFAQGMSYVGFCLGPPLLERALAHAATRSLEGGENWVAFTLFRDDWPVPDLPFWARKAYVYVRESKVENGA